MVIIVCVSAASRLIDHIRELVGSEQQQHLKFVLDIPSVTAAVSIIDRLITAISRGKQTTIPFPSPTQQSDSSSTSTSIGISDDEISRGKRCTTSLEEKEEEELKRIAAASEKKQQQQAADILQLQTSYQHLLGELKRTEEELSSVKNSLDEKIRTIRCMEEQKNVIYYIHHYLTIT